MIPQIIIGGVLGYAANKLIRPESWLDFAGALALYIACLLLGMLVTLEGLNSAIR